jgi:hypothetical protein
MGGRRHASGSARSGRSALPLGESFWRCAPIWAMRYRRHAKNRLRWLRVSDADIERMVAAALFVDIDEEGRPRFVGEVDGVGVRVVIALDEPDLVVTTHPMGRR